MRLAVVAACLAMMMGGCGPLKHPDKSTPVDAGTANILWNGVLDVALSDRSSPEACVTPSGRDEGGGSTSRLIKISFEDAFATDCVSVIRGDGEKALFADVDAALTKTGWKRQTIRGETLGGVEYVRHNKGTCDRARLWPMPEEMIKARFADRSLWLAVLKHETCEPGK